MSSDEIKILLVDDEVSIRRALKATLTLPGVQLVTAARGEEALSLVRMMSFAAVLLDINMPGMSGVETCQQMRRIAPRLSILMLTVRDGEQDKIDALDAGADDFVTKPFHVGELSARVRAAVRRSQALDQDRTVSIRVGDIELDPGRRVVSKGGTPLHVTPKEFELLHHLMANAGLPIRHAKLLNTIWGPDYGNELEYLRTFICQIRKKVEDNPAKPRYLLTESHIGYRFAAHEWAPS
jgi:two-component system KDP operon response regulator KdpE